MTDVIGNAPPAVVPPVLNDGSPPGHAEKMLAMGVDTPEVDGVVEPVAPGVTPRPADVPEKFWDAEKGVVNTAALLKSQADAEAALRAANAPAPTPEEVAAKAAADAAAAAAAAAATPAQADVVANASTEFAEKGGLSAETYAALNTAGLSNDMVNEYIAGQQAIVGTLQTAAYEPFDGTADGYNEAAQWAANNLDESEIQALDVQLTSNNPAIVTQGAKALASKYAENKDVEPDTIRGNSNNPASGGVYTSSREMMKDMNSNKYRTDAGFRNEVAAKLSRSNI